MNSNMKTFSTLEFFLARKRKIQHWQVIAALLSLIAVGLLLRLGPLIHRDFWMDELYTIFFASSKTSIWESVIHPVDDRPPLFYLFVRFLLAFGTDKVFLRLPSLFFSLSCIPLAYLIFQKSSKTTGLVAAAVMTFTPFLIEYGWQLRDYGLLLPLALLSTGLMLELLERLGHKQRVTTRLLLALTLCNALGCLVNYVYLFFLAALLLSAFGIALLTIRQKKKVLSTFIHLLLFHLPLLLLLGYYLSLQRQTIILVTEWIPDPNQKAIINLFSVANGVGFHFDPVFDEKPSRTALILLFTAVIYLCATVIIFFSRKVESKLKNAVLLGFFTLTGSLLLCLATSSYLDRSLFIPRTFLPGAVAYSLGVAVCITYLMRSIFFSQLALFPLFAILTGFLGFLFFDEYFQHYPFLFSDFKVNNYTYEERLIREVRAQMDNQTQLIFVPKHYQDLYMASYFRKEPERGEFSYYVEEDENLATALKSGKKTNFMLFVSTTLTNSEEAKLFLNQDYVKYSFERLGRTRELCGGTFVKVGRNFTFDVEKCVATQSAASTDIESHLP